MTKLTVLLGTNVGVFLWGKKTHVGKNKILKNWQCFLFWTLMWENKSYWWEQINPYPSEQNLRYFCGEKTHMGKQNKIFKIDSV